MGLKNIFKKKDIKKRFFKEFSKYFSGNLIVIGYTIDNEVLDFITKIELKNIKRIIIVTPYSNLDKKFIDSWSGLSKFLDEMGIELSIRGPKEDIPSDIFFLSKILISLPRNSLKFDNPECRLWDDRKKKDKILSLIASSEDLKHLKGSKIYHRKFEKIFQIDERKLTDGVKNSLLDGLVSWEKSNYEDIEPIWRILEKKIREFIKLRLSDKGKDNWFSKMVLPALKEKIREAILDRFDTCKKRLGISKIDQYENPNVFLVAENYKFIINHNKKYFQDYKSNSNKKYRQYLEEVIQARNPSIHDRPKDIGTDYYSDTICKIMMILEWLDELEPRLIDI